MTIDDTFLSDFRTSDLALVAALYVYGFLAEDEEKAEDGRLTFIFNDGESLQEAVKKYWRGDLIVEPQRYFNQLRALKARIYQR